MSGWVSLKVSLEYLRTTSGPARGRGGVAIVNCAGSRSLCQSPESHAIRRAQLSTTPTRAFTASSRRKSAKLAETSDRPQRSRINEVTNAQSNSYPRLAVDCRALSCGEFLSKYDTVRKNQTVEEDTVVIYGMSHGRLNDPALWKL